MYPLATYRLQFHCDFGFDDAARLAPYLAQLGITHVYASPYLRARPGSKHGYDIVAHDQLNPELGDDAAFERMVTAFKNHGLRQLLDIVPNHMGVGGADNPLWLNVLEWGQESRFGGWFDIDWEPDQQYLHGKVLAPFLSNQYGIELENGKLELRFDATAGEFSVWAYDTHRLPICPLHYASILGNSYPELQYLGDDFSALTEWRPQIERRATELKDQLAKLIADDAEARHVLESVLTRINAGGLAPAPRAALHQLIKQQYWRATHFRVAGDDINYRRFFNINDLAGLRVELPDVFDHSHKLILQLYAAGVVDGLRIDHIDGLLDPATYLHRLSAAAIACRTETHTPYIVVEKILTGNEQLHTDWPIAGTTGYEAGNALVGILIDPSGQQQLSDFYTTFTGERSVAEEVIKASKLQIMNNEMAGELNVIARDAARIGRQSPYTADFTKNILSRAIKAWVACFGMYRTYIDSRGTLRPHDIELINEALRLARNTEPDIDPSVFDFLKQLLCGELLSRRGEFIRHSVLRCAMKLQQYSGPVMAKGLEDTAFYRFNRLIALNDVGSDPRKFGISIDEFHQTNLHRAQCWPHSLLCTSSHDSKRGEDARTRLAALSEIPEEWCQRVTQWQIEFDAINPAITVTRNDMYVLYQLIMATLPPELQNTSDDSHKWEEYAERVKAAMQKSVREAKQNSTWTAPNSDYEAMLMQAIDVILLGARNSDFHHSLFEFQARIAVYGAYKSVVQTALKFLIPGVPDIYQGSELWNLSMVDPDNRRPVDFNLRQYLLDTVQTELARGRKQAMQTYMNKWQSGCIKLALTHLLLAYRCRYPELFGRGNYVPCLAHGAHADEIIAFVRCDDTDVLLVVAWRFPRSIDRNLSHVRNTWLELPDECHFIQWNDILTNSTFNIDELRHPENLFHTLPVAVLVPNKSSNNSG